MASSPISERYIANSVLLNWLPSSFASVPTNANSAPATSIQEEVIAATCGEHVPENTSIGVLSSGKMAAEAGQ